MTIEGDDCTSSFKKDILLRTIYFASLIDISFDATNLPLPKVVVVPNPIHELFRENPRIFATQIPILKKYNIRSFDQCITADGRHLLPYDLILANASPKAHSGKVARWFTFLKSHTTNLISANLHPNVTRLWLSYWNEYSSQVVFGRTLLIDYDSFSSIVVH